MSHIFLYGPLGTGKSTIGKKLANNLLLPFVDLDNVIETNAGMPIPRIMETQGKSVFRDLETSALRDLSDKRESVIALGGGALLRDANRAFAEKDGKVILLMAGLDTLVERLKIDSNERPLLTGDLREKLSSLLERRKEHYASFANQLHVDDKSVEQVVHHVQVMLGRHRLSSMGEYDVIVGDVSNLKMFSIQYPIIVTDDKVAELYIEKIQSALPDSRTVIVPNGEAYKNLETISLLWKSFLENGLDRKGTVIALGGGVIGDMVGFAASTYMRGIDWIAIPTTLLSMVDASLGGKTGFDLPEGKNLIGSFHSPKLVLADPSLLLTLTDREFRSGMAEVIKHGIISDPELFQLCRNGLDWVKDNLEEIVKRAMAVKIEVIEEDPYEKGNRAALNLGHTVGHAVELVSRFELRHGEAIAIGMVTEARYAERIGIARNGLSAMISETLADMGLPIEIPRDMSSGEIISAMKVDKKKKARMIRFALPVEIGRVELVDVTDLEDVVK